MIIGTSFSSSWKRGHRSGPITIYHSYRICLLYGDRKPFAISDSLEQSVAGFYHGQSWTKANITALV